MSRDSLGPRRVIKKVSEHLNQCSCVLIQGTQRVGKTEMACKFAQQNFSHFLYLDLSREEDATAIQHCPGVASDYPGGCIVLDEIVEQPEILRQLGRLLDDPHYSNSTGPAWLILGPSDAAFGRMIRECLKENFRAIELLPIDVLELRRSGEGGFEDSLDTFSAEIAQVSDVRPDFHSLTLDLWLRGGFPESYFEDEIEFSLSWRKNHVTSIFNKIIENSEWNSPCIIESLWETLCKLNGKACDYSQINRRWNQRKAAFNWFVGRFEERHLIRRIVPWNAANSQRAKALPYIYVRDSGFLHAGLDIKTVEQLSSDTRNKGKSWEGFVLENLLAVAPPETRAFTYRNSDNDEADFILEFENSDRWVIEVKSTRRGVSRGFHEACKEVQPKEQMVIHAHHESMYDKKIQLLTLSDALQLL